jgi:branched-chain amino acid transport system substrate-binding protein
MAILHSLAVAGPSWMDDAMRRRHPSRSASGRRGFEPQGETLNNYTAVQIWAHAVQEAGTTALDQVSALLRSQEFETVLGRIDFDGKGDVTEPGFAWYMWQDGDHVPEEDLTR